MSHALAIPSAVTSLLVAALAAILTLVAIRARQRTHNASLSFVAAAFAVFLVKNLFSAYNVLAHALENPLPNVPHDAIELVLSLFDLAILLLLVLPLARRRTET